MDNKWNDGRRVHEVMKSRGILQRVKRLRGHVSNKSTGDFKNSSFNQYQSSFHCSCDIYCLAFHSTNMGNTMLSVYAYGESTIIKVDRVSVPVLTASLCWYGMPKLQQKKNSKYTCLTNTPFLQERQHVSLYSITKERWCSGVAPMSFQNRSS